MNTQKFKTSALIANSLVPRMLNNLLGRIINLLFRKLDFDNESLLIMEQYREKGHHVYASFQSSNTSLLLLDNLLKKHGFNSPDLALGFIPYILQTVANGFTRAYQAIRSLLNSSRYTEISDEEYIANSVKSEKPVIISIISRTLFRKRYLQKMPDLLENLVKIQQNSETPVYVFPQIMFWNRNPERTKTFITTKATGDRGLLSGWFSTLRSMTPAFIRIAPPVKLDEFIASSKETDSVKIAMELRKHLMEINNHEKRTILGPVIKRQQEMMEQVLYHQNTLDTIQTLVGQKGISEKKLRKQAYGYIKEIAADFSIVMIKYFERTLGLMFRKIFKGIEYDIEAIKKIREESKHGPVIFVPSHKSHMDYLIISSIFYREKMIPPHILSGSNLTFFPMGIIFRKSGAFFMRRSFKGKELYATVFKQYIKTLLNERYSIEFFLEGGRTRSGRVLHPKLGILKYLIESVEEGYCDDLVFVPTTINYSRILEESSFSKELKGKEKKSESTSNFVKSRKLLKRNYGKVYLNFNEPIKLTQLQETHGNSQENMLDIAYDLTRRINDTIAVTPSSLLFTSILSSTGKGFTGEKLTNYSIFLRDYIISQGINVSEELRKDTTISSEAASLTENLSEEGIISALKVDSPAGKQKEELDFYILNQESRPAINFYKNTIMHYLLPLAFTSVALTEAENRESISFDSLQNTFTFLMKVFENEFVYSNQLNADPAEELKKALNFLQEKSCLTVKGETISLKETGLQIIQDSAALIQDLIESYVIACKTLSEQEKGTTKKEIEGEMKKRGIAMYHLGEVVLTESLSVPNYNNTLKFLLKEKALTMTPKGKKDIEIKITGYDEIENTYNSLNTLKTAIHVTSIKSGRLKDSSSLDKDQNSLQDNVH